MNSTNLEICKTDAANWKMGLGMYSVYCGLFVVLFANLYCTKKDKSSAARGMMVPTSSNKGSNSCYATYKPAFDVGDAVGNFHGHEIQRNGPTIQMSEMQSPKRVKKTSGAMDSLRNVCAVEGVGEDDDDTGFLAGGGNAPKPDVDSDEFDFQPYVKNHMLASYYTPLLPRMHLCAPIIHV